MGGGGRGALTSLRIRAELCNFEFLSRTKLLSLLLLDWSMDFPEIKYMYVNTNRYEYSH